MSNKQTKNKVWVPVLKRVLEENFSKSDSDPFPTAKFSINSQFEIRCLKCSREDSKNTPGTSYPDDFPDVTIDVTVSCIDRAIMWDLDNPTTLFFNSILNSYPRDFDSLFFGDTSKARNSTIYDYNGTALYQMLTHFTNMGAKIIPKEQISA